MLDMLGYCPFRYLVQTTDLTLDIAVTLVTWPQHPLT